MAVHLEEFVDSIENLPGEIKHYFAEIRTRDDAAQELRKQIMAAQKNYMVAKDGAEAVPIAEKIRKDYNQARDLTNEKIRLSDRAMDLLQRHIKRLDDTLLEATKDVDEAALPGGQMYDATPTVDKKKKLEGSLARSRSRKLPRTSSFMDVDEEMEDMEDAGDGEPLYCICQQVSFGEMIACDNAEKCPYEWFHYECVGLSEPPQGTWYCPICLPKVGGRPSLNVPLTSGRKKQT